MCSGVIPVNVEDTSGKNGDETGLYFTNALPACSNPFTTLKDLGHPDHSLHLWRILGPGTGCRPALGLEWPPSTRTRTTPLHRSEKRPRLGAETTAAASSTVDRANYAVDRTLSPYSGDGGNHTAGTPLAIMFRNLGCNTSNSGVLTPTDRCCDCDSLPCQYASVWRAWHAMRSPRATCINCSLLTGFSLGIDF